MITGYFCTVAAVLSACAGVPAHRLIVHATHVEPQCQAEILPVTFDGRTVAEYVDDSVGPLEPAAQGCARQSSGLPVFAASYGTPVALADNLVEWYPVLDTFTVVPPAPAGGVDGYILQAFSWGDNVADGEVFGRCTPADTQASCAAKYQPPSQGQLDEMWCEATAHHPPIVLWYYAGGEQLPMVEQAMASSCAPPPSPPPMVTRPSRPRWPCSWDRCRKSPHVTSGTRRRSDG